MRSSDPPSLYSGLVTLLIGGGALVAGIALRRKVRELRQAGAAPRPAAADRFHRQKVDNLVDTVVPYFLMFCGAAFLLAGVALVVERITG